MAANSFESSPTPGLSTHTSLNGHAPHCLPLLAPAGHFSSFSPVWISDGGQKLMMTHNGGQKAVKMMMTHDGGGFGGQKTMKTNQNAIHLDREIRSNWARHK